MLLFLTAGVLSRSIDIDENNTKGVLDKKGKSAAVTGTACPCPIYLYSETSPFPSEKERAVADRGRFLFP